jgi:hypothetical protein
MEAMTNGGSEPGDTSDGLFVRWKMPGQKGRPNLRAYAPGSLLFDDSRQSAVEFLRELADEIEGWKP